MARNALPRLSTIQPLKTPFHKAALLPVTPVTLESNASHPREQRQSPSRVTPVTLESNASHPREDNCICAKKTLFRHVLVVLRKDDASAQRNSLSRARLRCR
eukprot:366216-Chlamydomonas_euryale.AAC.11